MTITVLDEHHAWSGMQIISIFMAIYESVITTKEEKREFFDLLCRDFGVQGLKLHAHGTELFTDSHP